MKPKTKLDYVELYAKELNKNKHLFKQHKILIESQIKASKEIFRNRFGKNEDFKKNARDYLKKLAVSS